MLIFEYQRNMTHTQMDLLFPLKSKPVIYTMIRYKKYGF